MYDGKHTNRLHKSQSSYIYNTKTPFYYSILFSPLDMNSWCKYMMLAKCIFINPSSQHSSWHDMLRIVRDWAKLWSEGNFAGLWGEVVAEESRASHKPRKSNLSTNSLRYNNARWARWAVQVGHFSKVIKALFSISLAKATIEVREELFMKHSQARLPQLPEGPPPTPDQIDSTNVFNCLKSFPFRVCSRSYRP